MSRWRKKLARSGAEKMLEESLKTGLREGFIKKSELTRVNVDSTVQEKAVRYPTDARLYDRLRERLVKSARKNGIELRQTYERIGKKVLRSQSGYAKANQFKRARKATKQLKTFLGRVLRDVKRKMTAPDMELQKLLDLGERLFNQKKSDKKKLYSIHESQVECIGKGKAHKKFEFGTKVGLVTSAKANWIMGAEAYPGNPYDGHTLKSALQQASKILGFEPEMAICDLGYRGHNYEGRCAAGFNIRKLMRAFALFLYQFFKLALIQLVNPLNQGGSKRFGKGRAREGKNLSSKGSFLLASGFCIIDYSDFESLF